MDSISQFTHALQLFCMARDPLFDPVSAFHFAVNALKKNILSSGLGMLETQGRDVKWVGG